MRANKPMTTDSDSAKMLANVIAGNHPPVTEQVKIGAALGEGVSTTAVAGAAKLPIPAAPVTKAVHALDSDESATTVSIKDLRQRADKAVTEQRTAAQKAAESGDYSAAISAPATPAPAPVKKPESKKATAKPKPAVERKKPAEPKVVVAAVGYKADGGKPLPEKHTLALVLHAEGKSNRQIEAELHICRKTLKKLFDARGLTPNG